MALIKCPECGKEISDKSNICIGCGYPIKEYLETKSEETTIQKCSYCGSEDIDIDGYCNKCGKKILNIKKETNNQDELKRSAHTVCPECGSLNKIGVFNCQKCGHHYLMSEYKIINPIEKVFTGIYKYSIFGEKIEVRCPRCGSENCSHYQEQKIIPGKTKTRYTANLNPLKPFTLLNKKEKVVKKEQVITECKFICNSCGKIFY